ncbi:PREDICTED: DEP domain-containing protein 1B isoform X2 [Poecilia mexicana]|uniref:DEP domain containing 1B n=2 Tax=Poecilia TaxID=8080 RepID=A0A087YMI4_POEFO|nr:PREDICTED: DEP domain-containing protein 1B isoform X2 [Poecilia formosa]XP_014861279.1 PREDICTED: DEP domain-containing protein 1B isoform X2 [Poecilia mexicana]
MEGQVIGAGPYRATKLWNETIKLFRGGMPLRRHWANFRCYDCTFTGSEAVDYLHELLRSNYNFGPEVTRYQTLQLLRKFFKAHVIEDVKGRHGTEDFEDNSHLYRFPTMSPLKSLPTRPSWRDDGDLPRLIRWDDYEELPQKENVAPQKSAELTSDLWNKRHSVAIGDVHECKLIRRREVTSKQVDHIWKSMTITHLQRVLGLKTLDGILNPAHVNGKDIVVNIFNVNKTGIVVLENKAEDMPYWVVSAMKCLANWPEGNDAKQPLYPGFERDVLRTVADYYQKLKEPLLTFHLYEVFVNILSLLQEQDKAIEALQVSCLLLPPPNRRRLQLLLRLMARVCHNPRLPPLNDTIATRTLMVQMFSHCVLGSPDDMDLDELLATKLVTFMMEHHGAISQVNAKLRCQVEEHLSHLKRAQIKYAGSDTDFSASPAFCKQIKRVDCEEQKVIGTQIPLQQLLEGLIADQELPAKDKRKRLKQFQKSYPEVYQKRFPTEESKAAVIPEKAPRLKPHLVLFNLKKPFQPFQRSWSFRA